MHRVLTTLAMCLLLSASSPVTAQQDSKVVRVRFAKGATSRTYRDSVSHSVNTYTVRARKGQTMSIVVTSPGNQASFSISQLPAPDADPVDLAADRKRWTDKLTNSGNYYINVGAERSVSSYTITITVK